MNNFPYCYDTMLKRLQLEKSSEEQYKKMSLPSLKIVRKNKTSVFVNFSSYPLILKRNSDHIGNYFRTEMGTDYSINSSGQLILQGIFKENKFESIMKKYIKEFVSCRQCRGLNSDLIKENGITFLECHICLAKTSLGKI